MKKIFLVILAFSIMVTLVHCTPKAARTTESIPTPEQIAAQFTIAQLDEGKMLMQSSCNKCHKLFDPITRTPEKWDRVLRRMIPRAKLSEEEGTLVRAYILANAKSND
jgi:cytochrome c5